MDMSDASRRLLHVISNLDVGGAERMLTQLATARGGWAADTVVVSLLPGGFHADVLRGAGIRVIELNFRTAAGIVGGVLELVRTIRRFRPAVVQGWMYHGDLLAWLGLVLAGRRRHSRLIWSIRCSDMDLDRYGTALRAVVRICALLSSRPDLVTANSAAGMRVHAALGYRPRRTEIIPNGIDVARFKPDAEHRLAVRRELGIAEQAVVVAHVARVDPMKDHDGFLAAMAALPDVHAILIGRGTEQLAGAPNLHRLGHRSDVPRLLAAADAIVSSSAFGEGFSNAVAEGMACGLPAIATDVGDAREIIGDAGIVVPPRAPDALAAAMRSFADQPWDHRAALGQRARARICETFTIEQALARFSSAYQRME
jgi:glycosyltransferase involved in cell wall biosynthesis